MRKKLIVLMIFCLEFFLGIIGVLIMMNSIDKKTEKNTAEFVATITKVDVTNTGKGVYIEIATKEYESLLYISTNISKRINMDNINNLQKGQTIFFRIEDNMIEQLGKVYFCNIVSLRTTETEIISLTGYNAYIHDAAVPARSTGIVFAGIFLSVFIYCCRKIKRNT